MVLFLCVAGLPPNILDYPEYKTLMHTLNPRYKPMSRTTMADSAIPSTHAHVQKQQDEYLRTQLNLTVSFDGGGTRAQHGFYTVHATTSDDRAFLQNMVDGRSVSHTGKWIHDEVLAQMDHIGRFRFAAVTSDSTGNTKVARRLLCESVPTLLNCPDPIHHINLLIKDICKLEYFQGTIHIISKTMTHFSHSNDSTEKLDTVRREHNIGRGLEKIGKTRFGTVVWAALSLRRCLSSIRQLVGAAQIELKVRQYFESGDCNLTHLVIGYGGLL